ncbi:hypothetical protein [Caballeronia choica]|uniref:hypothetical protein n=1 Tax=Caballeronia choica TaxID=326476 RepID=UPI000B12194A|nr:hypothetical protein [Caballeronia choica]
MLARRHRTVKSAHDGEFQIGEPRKQALDGFAGFRPPEAADAKVCKDSAVGDDVPAPDERGLADNTRDLAFPASKKPGTFGKSSGKRLSVVRRSPFIADSMETTFAGRCEERTGVKSSFTSWNATITVQSVGCVRSVIGGGSRFGLSAAQGCAVVSNAGAWPNRRLTFMRRSPI